MARKTSAVCAVLGCVIAAASAGCSNAKKDQGTTYALNPTGDAARQQAQADAVRGNPHMNGKAQEAAMRAMQQAQTRARSQAQSTVSRP